MYDLNYCRAYCLLNSLALTDAVRFPTTKAIGNTLLKHIYETFLKFCKILNINNIELVPLEILEKVFF